MRTWRPDFDPSHLYFVTTTAVDHTRVFQRDVVKRLVLDHLDAFRLHHRWKLFAFVIMPNHVHVVVQCDEGNSLAEVMRDLKRDMADRLIRHLKAERNEQGLEYLARKVGPSRHQHYRVWEEGYLAKDVMSPDFLRQKLTYIHENPCQAHWQLAERPEAYLWSSARFYLTRDPCIIPVDDARLLM